jgi:hypothetical protein
MPIAGLTLTGLVTFGARACGSAFSATLGFAAAPGAPVTRPATVVAGTTATLHGEVTPGLDAEEVEYDLAYSSVALCTEGGAVIPSLAAALEAQVNPENQKTTLCEFQYGTTKAQKLAKALKARKKRAKRDCAVCEARARNQYAVKHTAASKKK